MDVMEIRPDADPADALAAVAALRRLADQLEDVAVERAMRAGWGWPQVAEALGVTRQAVHKKHAARLIAARSWLRVYQLPPYASELNPVEPVWSNLKRSLANLTKHNISQLTALIKTRLKRMQYRPGLLEGFLAKTGLDLGNFHN